MQQEYTYVLSRKGRYNLLDPSKESISTYIAIMNPDGTKKMYCNITTEDIIDNDCDLISEIKNYTDRWHGSSVDEAKKVKQYLEENEEKLSFGNYQRELKAIEETISKLNLRKEVINKILKSYNTGDFDKGVWIE